MIPEPLIQQVQISWHLTATQSAEQADDEAQVSGMCCKLSVNHLCLGNWKYIYLLLNMVLVKYIDEIYETSSSPQ